MAEEPTTEPTTALPAASDVDLPLDRDLFFRTMLRELSGTLEDVVGMDEAAGFVSVVGDRIGRTIDHGYRTGLGTQRLSREQVAEVLVDLKARIGGDFYVIEQDDDRIVLGNRACPFGEKVLGRGSLCMMTSNVFGVIAANNFGYARVELQETIARGASGCHVVVHLRADDEAGRATGREYFGDLEPAPPERQDP